jgi:hypothetical protein
MTFIRRGTVVRGAALVGVLAAGVVIAVSSRSPDRPAAPAPAAATTTVAADDPQAVLTPDLRAAFSALDEQRQIIDPARLRLLEKLRQEFRHARPGETFLRPVAWMLRTAGDADYAAVSYGPQRLCLVAFPRDRAATDRVACAPAEIAEDPRSPLTSYGPITASSGGIVSLVATGVTAVKLDVERGSPVVADVVNDVAVAASPIPPRSFVVTGADGSSITTPLAADSGTAFYLSVQEAARRDSLLDDASALADALVGASASGGLSLDRLQDRWVRVAIDTTEPAEDQAAVRAIVARYPRLAGEVDYVLRSVSSDDLVVLMNAVSRAWGSDPGLVFVELGDGVVGIAHLPGPLPPAVQAIVAKSPERFHITEVSSYPQVN